VIPYLLRVYATREGTCTLPRDVAHSRSIFYTSSRSQQTFRTTISFGEASPRPHPQHASVRSHAEGAEVLSSSRSEVLQASDTRSRATQPWWTRCGGGEPRNVVFAAQLLLFLRHRTVDDVDMVNIDPTSLLYVRCNIGTNVRQGP
jgi:hypothetical protein